MEHEPPFQAPEHAPALLIKSHRFSLIWLVPALAALAALYLAIHSFYNRGPKITISFETATGIEAGRTKIKHRDADMGMVESVTPTEDLSHVVVIVRMEKIAEPFLTKDAQFWVVKPSLSNKDLSALGTFISGPFIEFEPGDNNADKGSSSHYVGLESPAFMPAQGDGSVYTVHTKHLDSVGQGTPIYFHGIQVGQVLGYELANEDGTADLRIFIQAPNNTLIHTGTHFWNQASVSVNTGPSGFNLQLGSIRSLFSGGITFDVPKGANPGDVAPAGTDFTLYADEESARDAIYTKRINFMLHFKQPVIGLVAGSPVRLQGMPIGQVKSVELDYDTQGGYMNMPVIIEVEAERINQLRDKKDAEDFDKQAYEVFRKLVSSGLRAKIGSGSLITGQKVIDLANVLNAPRAKLIEGGAYPEIPTASGDDVDALMRSANELLSQLQMTVGNLNTIVGSPEMMESVHSLNQTLKEASTALSSENGGGDLPGTLRELKDAARSARVLMDYLEAHPESLIQGKPKDSQP